MGELRSVGLLAACDVWDEARIEQLGWRPVLDALRAWPKRLNGGVLSPFCSLLGDEDPEAVAGVLRGLAGVSEWRPSPIEIYQLLHPPSEKPVAVPQGRIATARSDQTPRAYAAVRAFVGTGSEVCECFPRPTTVEINHDGVLRCPDCGGLEPGQVDAALEEVA
jgi:hypothetical protein